MKKIPKVIHQPSPRIRSFLERHQPQQPASEGDLFLMRRAAWKKQGVVVVRPEEIPNDWVRQALVNEANRQFGKREIPHG